MLAHYISELTLKINVEGRIISIQNNKNQNLDNQFVDKNILDILSPKVSRKLRKDIAEVLQTQHFKTLELGNTTDELLRLFRLHIFPVDAQHLNVFISQSGNQASFSIRETVNHALDRTASVFVTNADSEIIFVNQKFCDISGYAEQELIGQKYIDFLHHDTDDELLSADIRHSVRHGKIWRGEIKYQHKKGRDYWLFSSIIPHLNAEGQPFRFVSVGFDITQTKLTEELLVRSEKRFSDIYTNMPVMLITTDAKLRIRDVSAFCTQKLGYTKEELIGKSFLDFVDMNDIVGDKQKAYSRKLEDYNGKSITLKIRRKTAGMMEAYVTSQFEKLPSGETKSIFISIKDITKLRRTQRKLQDQKYALDQSAIVTIADVKGTILYGNEKFVEISGYTHDEFLGKNHSIINSGYHPQEFFQTMWRTIAKGEIWRGEFRNQAKNGQFYWVDTTIVPLLDERGKPKQYLAVRFEITGKKVLEEQIYEYNLHLEDTVNQRTKELKIKNLELHSKNKYILDSINYAKRIQETILPPVSKLQQYFKDVFILWKPKDKVSGDFYWFKTTENYGYLVAADCTGHGVPGAFMSMISSALLQEIIKDVDEPIPSQILETLHERIRKLLRQETNESRDGLDIALCRYNKNTKKLDFSGAHNALVVIQNDEMQVIKGNRNGIAGRVLKKRIYDNHTLQLEENAVFYVFTDGYQDQFGGIDKKKLYFKQFRSLLMAIHKQRAERQECMLDEYFENWRTQGQEKQIDDVLVIGIKI